MEQDVAPSSYLCLPIGDVDFIIMIEVGCLYSFFFRSDIDFVGHIIYNIPKNLPIYSMNLFHNNFNFQLILTSFCNFIGSYIYA